MGTKLVTSRPAEPDFVGAVIRWEKWGGYNFASIRDPAGMWYTTQDPDRFGRQVIAPVTWQEFLDSVVGEKNWATMELLS